MAIAGGGDSRDLERAIVAKPVATEKAGPAVRGAAGQVIQTFYVQNKVVPESRDDPVFGPRCPRNAGSAIDGGAATEQGIDLIYMSQLSPSNLESSPRTYYVGIEDVSNANSANAGAFLEVQCAKGITVRK